MLIVVRHGRTAANAAGLLQGRVDNPLDDVGRAQAEAIADVLVGCHRPVVVASPLRRARETADAVARRLGAPVQIDDRFVELDYGVLDGVPTKDVGADTWARWRVDPDFAPESGESLATLQTRVAAACTDLAETAAERDVLVFSHVSPIKAVVAWALGVGPEITWRLHVAQATITRVRTGPTIALTSFNEIAHLDGI